MNHFLKKKLFSPIILLKALSVLGSFISYWNIYFESPATYSEVVRHLQL